MSVYEMAVKYYPSLWDKARLKKLVDLGKISQAEYKKITGEKYEK